MARKSLFDRVVGTALVVAWAFAAAPAAQAQAHVARATVRPAVARVDVTRSAEPVTPGRL
jgi:hypothetical protein